MKHSVSKRQGILPPNIETVIRLVRDQKVILDSDLARLYGVTTSVLNQALKRNPARFPGDFVFQITKDEWENLRSQTVISSRMHGGRRFLPHAFTEHGAVMAANVLNSHLAITMSVYVVRAFVKLRENLVKYQELKEQLEKIERKIVNRQQIHERAILKLFDQIRRITEAPAPSKPQRKIGF